jgi:hypothetical protein
LAVAGGIQCIANADGHGLLAIPATSEWGCAQPLGYSAKTSPANGTAK